MVKQKPKDTDHDAETKCALLESTG